MRKLILLVILLALLIYPKPAFAPVLSPIALMPQAIITYQGITFRTISHSPFVTELINNGYTKNKQRIYLSVDKNNNWVTVDENRLNSITIGVK